MELEPSNAPLPPFWAAVRRRHPDVDLVLLPDPEAEATDVPGDEVETAVLDAVARVDAVVEDLGADPPARARIGYGPEPGSVVPRVRLASHREDGAAALNRLRDQLAERGWSVRRPEGGVARLVAHHGDLHVRASFADQTRTFLLDISSDPIQVGNVRARELADA